jgi:hypothetical protein
MLHAFAKHLVKAFAQKFFSALVEWSGHFLVIIMAKCLPFTALVTVH